MKIGAFTAEVPEGRETEGGYVILEHGQQYSLRLRSEHTGDCDVTVSIDGHKVGAWRLEPGYTYRVERPIDEPGKFTFYVGGTGEAAKAGISIGHESGLLVFHFMPEDLGRPFRLAAQATGGEASEEDRRWMAEMLEAAEANSANRAPDGARAGATGLSGFSEQTFSFNTKKIVPDHRAAVTINLRLIAVSNEPRPLRRSNSVPPPVSLI